MCVQANEDVTQAVEVFDDEVRKFPWLMARMAQFQSGLFFSVYVYIECCRGQCADLCDKEGCG